MAERASPSPTEVDAQLLRTHATSPRMRRLVLGGSLLIYLTVDTLNQLFFGVRPLWFHIALDGLFALALGVSVLLVFRQHDAKQQAALQAAMRERRTHDQLAIQLATVRETARAVSHELNQPLAIIRGYAELIQTAPPGQSIQAELTGILTATDRAAALARDLFRITRYATHTATDGRPMLNVQESVEPPALIE
jgi:signal transduction histidine kinase